MTLKNRYFRQGLPAVLLICLACTLATAVFTRGAHAQGGRSEHSRDIIEYLRSKGQKERNSAAEMTGGRVGYVDVLTVLLFHPYMTDYSVYDNRFEMTVPDSVPEHQREEYMKQQVNDHQKRVDDLQEKIALKEKEYQQIEVKIELARKDLSDSHEKLRSQFQREVEDAALSNQEEVRIRWRAEVTKLEDKFFTRNKELKLDREKLNRTIQELGDDLKKAAFSTTAYTMKKFQEIFDDISEAIDEVSYRNKIGLVFNQPVTTVYYPEDENEIKFDNVYRIFFDALAAGEAQRFNVLKHTGPVQLSAWYTERPKLFRNLIDLGLDQIFYRIILKGGINLTGEVLQYVLDKHRMDPEVQELILKLMF